MSNFLTSDAFLKLSRYAFSAENRGFRPDMVEAPNGDGQFDWGKRYAHVAPKYGLGPCEELHQQVMSWARSVSEALGIPSEFYPGNDSTIRVLEYPPGTTSAPHTDFDLFTLSLFRKDVDAFRYLDETQPESLTRARTIAPGIHFGELLTEVMGWPATKHEVVARNVPTGSAVFFVMPSLDAVLPSGLTVRNWIQERKGRSRAKR